MLEIFNYLKKLWNILNEIHPETRTLIIILLFGWILYSQITDNIYHQLCEKSKEEVISNKKAEQYSLETGVEINNIIQMISERDQDAFDVLLLNYHNNTQSLQGYKYLYLSCLTEAPRSLDTPTLQQQWNKLDYIYYADELAKIHSQGFVKFNNLEQLGNSLPKLYRLVKASDAEAISFFTIEGHNYPIGMVIILYNKNKEYNQEYTKKILPCIQKLAILLDYEKIYK